MPLAELDLSGRVPRSFMPNATLLGVMPANLAHGSSDQRDVAQRVRFATGTTPTADVLASDSSSARPPTGDELARRPSTGFDLQRQARRDAMARLAVWVVILAAITLAALIALR